MYAKYTVYLKTLLEDKTYSALIDEVLNSYPLYEKKSNEEYIPSIIPTREQLNKKLLNAYKYREIGFETPARFADELGIALNEIMPYYNQLFFTADQDYNIIYNVDYQRTISRDRNDTEQKKVEGSSSGSSQTENQTSSQSTENAHNETTATDETTTNATNKNNAKIVKVDTPQSVLSIGTKNIGSVDVASDAEWNETTATSDGTSQGENSAVSDSTNSGSASSEGTSNVNTQGESNVTEDGTKTEKEETLETTKGNFGVVSAQDLVAKYREIILNIEQMIINDARIKELFMMVY